MKPKFLKEIMIQVYLSVILAFLTACSSNVQNGNGAFLKAKNSDEKMKGLSFVASSRPFEASEFEPLKSTNANYLAIMPFAFMPSANAPNLSFAHERQWWGERPDGCQETIKMAKKNGFGILLKPQIWIGGGVFTGTIQQNSEADWTDFERNYRDFVLKFAEIAEAEKVEVFCIGTELEQFVRQRPDFWKRLIRDVRAVFSGKLTYAENWDCFDQPSFLSELDYIGVDAYFPLAEGQHPSKEAIRNGWTPHLLKMKSSSQKYAKPILLTECGYRSVDFAAEKPWDFSREKKSVNETLQADLLSVMFEEVWTQEWCAGGFIWKWFPFHERAGGAQNNQFTPQNKQAQQVITSYFAKLP